VFAFSASSSVIERNQTWTEYFIWPMFNLFSPLLPIRNSPKIVTMGQKYCIHRKAYKLEQGVRNGNCGPCAASADFEVEPFSTFNKVASNLLPFPSLHIFPWHWCLKKNLVIVWNMHLVTRPNAKVCLLLFGLILSYSYMLCGLSSGD